MPAQSMREQLEDAFDDDQNDEAAEGQEEEAGGSAEDTTEPLGDSTEEPAGGEDAEEGAGDDSEGGDDTEGDKDDDAAASDDKVGSTKDEDSGDAKSALGKAPASWKPEAREDWGKIPKGAQREIARREKHMDNMVRESAESRKQQKEFTQLMHPFEPLIAAQNSTPFQAIHNLMSTSAGLTIGTPIQKAQIVANIIGNYGIDITELDGILVGGKTGQAPANNDMSQMLQQQLAPIHKFMGDMNTQRQNYETGQQQTLEQEIDTFAQDPKNEFFGDVKDTMADLMEMAGNRGDSMTIQQAYDKACRMDDGINGIIGGRTAANNAGANKKTIGKKRHAASSIHGTAASSGEGQSAETIRGALVDAWDDAV